MFMDSFAEYFTDKCETSWTFGDQYLWNSSRHSTFLTLFNQWQESVEHYWEESFHVYMSQWLGPNLASQFINPSWGLVTRGGTDHGESNELRHIFTSFCQVADQNFSLSATSAMVKEEGECLTQRATPTDQQYEASRLAGIYSFISSFVNGAPAAVDLLVTQCCHLLVQTGITVTWWKTLCKVTQALRNITSSVFQNTLYSGKYLCGMMVKNRQFCCIIVKNASISLHHVTHRI